MTDSYNPTLATFAENIVEHKLTIEQDIGLYRHLVCRRPGSCNYGFQIVTWPGYLAIVGDMSDFVFSRVPDMFNFFRDRVHDDINPQYWAEKIVDGRERAKRFDWERFKRDLWEHFKQTSRDLSPAARKTCRFKLSEAVKSSEPDEFGAVELIRNFSYRGATPRAEWSFVDFEGTGRDWDYHFIWCCRAIVWAIREYDAQKAAVWRVENDRRKIGLLWRDAEKEANNAHPQA